MPLVNLKPVLREAKAKGYAVAAFNPVDYASMKAMVKAAEELNAPVIIQTSAKTIKYYGHRALVEWMREIADDSPVPVVLHLDHGKDVEMIKKCVEMREKYSDFREKTLMGLLEQAQACRQHFKDYDEDMPEHVKSLVEFVEERALAGQFDAG